MYQTNEDDIERLSLSDENKQRIDVLKTAFKMIDEFKGAKMAAYAEAAWTISGRLPAMTRKSAAISAKSMARLYADYKKIGWRACVVDYSRPEKMKLPPPFVQFWQELYMQFQIDMSGAQAHRALISRLEDWRAGRRDAAIPGYAFPPPNTQTNDHPFGWSLKNLLRKKPSAMRRTLVKKGRSAAKAEFGPLVRQTRTDLEPGQLIVFDDVWQDHDVMFPGSKRLVRPLGLVALDGASGKQVSWGMRPRLREADGTSVGLKAFDMEAIVTDVLCRVGIHKDGATFAMERGTANVSEKTERFLFDRFRVRVERGGVDRAASFDGGFVGAFKGNSRFKAMLESHHNVVHNALSFIPAYVGKGRASPENTQGMQLSYAALIRKFERAGLPADVRDKLSVGALPWHVFIELYAAVLGWVNARTDHELEGWEKRMITEVRFAIDSPWNKLDAALLGEDVARALLANAGSHRTRKMSPTEAFSAGAGNLRRIAFPACAEMFIQPDKTDRSKTLDARIIKRVSDRHEFILPASADDPSEHIFSAEIEHPQNGIRILNSGDEFKVLLNPFSADELCVFTLDGRYLGSSAAKRTRVKIGDKDALLPAIGAASKEFNRLAHPANMLAKSRQDEVADAAAMNRVALARFAEENRNKTTLSESKKQRSLDAGESLAITTTLDDAVNGALESSTDDDFIDPSF